MISRDPFEVQRGDAAALERLYREAVANADEPAFREGLSRSAAAHPGDALLAAWVYRLDLRPLPAAPTHATRPALASHWTTAVAGSILMGLLALLCAGGQPPVPSPEAANPLFWIAWAPLTGLGILAFLALRGAAGNPDQRLARFGLPALAMVLVAGYVGLIFWGRTDQIAQLIALHLPLVAWAALGAGLCLRRPDTPEQGHAFAVKSVEIALTAGIYFGAWMLFVGLTAGIFSVLGFQPGEAVMVTAAAWGTGAVPLLALATVGDPSRIPTAQPWHTGLAPILRILTRLLLPLALAVLAVYLCWVVPAYFWRPFEEREVLAVYNATILAILTLMTAALTDPEEERSAAQDISLRIQLLALAALTFALNLYALAAILSRTLNYGLTPNRCTVLGWNIVTLLMLGLALAGQWRVPGAGWASALRTALGRGAALAALWALGVLLVLPWVF
ncbi:MAG: hypothetical protein IT369_03855 [Candidatus Latescibacteria bacterium]|nr:hypothetical protein [Candidatus Latescibacterota bacterium]